MATVDMPSIDPSKLPNNSYTARERREQETSETLSKAVEASKQPQATTVAQGKARKPSLVKKFARYIVEDSIENAREKTLDEIVIPGVKTLIFDTLTDMLDIILFGGEGAPMGRYSASAGASKRMSYSKFYEEKSAKKNRDGRSYRDAYEADDIILDTRNQANNVLNTLYGHIRKYGQVSVATYYDIVGVTGEWTDNRYGWTNINGAGIKPVRDGFMIILPPATLLEE